MSESKHVYLQVVDSAGHKHTVYPVTDVNSIIGLGGQNGDFLTRFTHLEKRVAALENKVNYH